MEKLVPTDFEYYILTFVVIVLVSVSSKPANVVDAAPQIQHPEKAKEKKNGLHSLKASFNF
jgi:hypothetical protein